MKYTKVPGKNPHCLYLALVLWALMLGTVLLSFGQYLQGHLPAVVVTTTPRLRSSRNQVQAAEMPKYDVPQDFATLIVMPEVAHPGEQIRVQSLGFLPGAAIKVSLKAEGMTDILVAETFADDMGMLNATFVLPAEAASFPQQVTVEATGEGEAEMKQLQGTLWISGTDGGGVPPPTATPTAVDPSPSPLVTTEPVPATATPVRPICTPTPTPRWTPTGDVQQTNCVHLCAGCICVTYTPVAAATVPPSATPMPTPTPTPIPFFMHYPNWRAAFYNNVHWQGDPTYVTNLPRIAFTWQGEGPAPILGKHLYSAHFTTHLPLAEGEYRFVLMADDWARLIIDQEEVALDSAWFWGRAPTTVRKYLSGGDHAIQIDYVQYWGQASLYFYWEPALDHPRWHGTYFDGSDLSGFALDVEKIAEEDFQHCWDNGPPDPQRAGTSASFSSRWTRRFEVTEAGLYQICVFTKDGVRLWVDRVRSINDWHPGAPRLLCEWVELQAMTHYIFIEHFVDRVDGQASFDDCLGVWIEPSAEGYWAAAYYDNPDLAGMPALVRSDPEVIFNWREASPDPRIPVDFFSAHWWRTFTLPWGEHRFYIQADDAARLRIDGRVVWDSYVKGPRPHPFATAVTVRHPQRVDVDIVYLERAGDASVRFWMTTPTATPIPRPTCTYTPAPPPPPPDTPTPTLCCVTATPECVTETPKP
jgi:hypothetical protein